MYIEKNFDFCASHILHRHPGKCGRLHGHNYQVTVGLEGSVDPSTCFVLDFGILKNIVKPIVDMLDHRHLNSFIRYPSAENIAVFIAHHLRSKLVLQDFDGMYVKVVETPNTMAVWNSKVRTDLVMLNQDPMDEKTEWAPPTGKGVPIVMTPSAVPLMVEDLKEEAAQLFEAFETALRDYEQLRLYSESMKQVERLP